MDRSEPDLPPPRRRAARFLGSGDHKRLMAHAALNQLALGFSGVFWIVFLLRDGVSPAGIFLAIGGVLALRFAFRPLVLLTVPRLGLRRTFMLGCVLSALQYPALALVQGPGWELAFFCVVCALGSVFYWTCYHTFFATQGDDEHRGSQLGLRQAALILANVLGPAGGGVALSLYGPWLAFGTSALVQLLSILPLRRVTDPVFARERPAGAYAGARTGILLFFTSGWLMTCSGIAWDILAFRALGERFDAFGGVIALAALAGALGALGLGHFIDKGHARRMAWANAAIVAGVIVLKALCGGDAILVVFAAVAASLLGGLYEPSLMTAVYTEAKAAPCALRFQFAAEGGWDAGGGAACLVSACACLLGTPLQLVLLLALPPIVFQTRILLGRYAVRDRAYG